MNAQAASPCCAPTGNGAQHHATPLKAAGPGQAGAVAPVGVRHRIEQAVIPAGVFTMGDIHHDGNRADGEDPPHPVQLGGFAIDTTSVTVADYRRFVADTGYATDAERHGASAVFHLAVPPTRSTSSARQRCHGGSP